MKFTVAIPAYKAKYLHECIESVLNQDYNDFEVVIVNDNSPQDIDTIVKPFVNNDSRVRYYKNDIGFGGKNVVKNWNKCLHYATGEYIICMGDDDKLSSDCLSNYSKVIEQFPDSDIFHTRTLIIDEESSIIDIQEPRPNIESVYSMIWFLWKGRDQFIGDFLFRTKRLKDIGGFYFLPYAWSSDKITAFLMAADKGIVNTSSIGFLYRRSSITITNSSNNQIERFDALLQERQWYIDFLKEKPKFASKLDYDLYHLCRSNIDHYMQPQLKAMCLWDLQDNPKHIFYWLHNKTKFQFNRTTCVKLILHSAKAFIYHLRRQFAK